MAYSYDFKDNVVYGAEDINGIRASVLTKGVVEESATSCMAEINEGLVKICEGQAIFSDGSRIKIDSDGVELEFAAGIVNYVFLLNNTLAGICEVKVQDSLPNDDYILIAEIDAEGNLSDKRRFAQLKTADTERFTESFSNEFYMSDSTEENGIIASITLPKINCSLIQMYMVVANEAYMQIKLLPKENNIMWEDTYGIFHFGGMDSAHYFYANGIHRTFGYETTGNQLIIRLVSTTRKESNKIAVKLAGICQR